MEQAVSEYRCGTCGSTRIDTYTLLPAGRTQPMVVCVECKRRAVAPTVTEALQAISEKPGKEGK